MITNTLMNSISQSYSGYVAPPNYVYGVGYGAQGQIDNDITGYKLKKIDTLTTWVSASCSTYHVMAIKTDGTLWTWGAAAGGALGNGTTTPDISSPVQIGTLSDWKSVSSGESYSMAIKTDGTLWGWGLNTSGQIGDSTSTNKSSPVQIGTLTNWKTVSCTLSHTMAVKTDGTLWAWGAATVGVLGNGTTTPNISSPVQIGTLANWATVSAGRSHTLAVKTDGTLWAWGAALNGRLGNGTQTPNLSSPVQIGTLTDWAIVSANDHSMAIKTNGTLWAWGGNSSGKLGTFNTTAYSSPVQIGADTSWKNVSGNQNHTIAVKTNGTLWVWGNAASGRYGDGSTVNKSSPVQVGTLTTWNNISTGNFTSLVITNNNEIYTTGGIVGVISTDGFSIGRTISYSSPIQITSISNISQVSSGDQFAVAIKKDNTIWGWGSNVSGQIGQTALDYYESPVQIGTLANWAYVSCGTGHTVALKTDGTLWAWGIGTSGQLGDGTSVGKSSPVQIGTLTDWAYVSAGGVHTMAVKTNGTLWAWGSANSGRLGNGTTTPNISSPVQIGTLANWAYVSAGGSHTIAVKTNGTIWSWGSNIFGQLGDNSIVDKSSPVQIGTLTTWSNIYAGLRFSVALKNNGELWSWGDNSSGQLGYNSAGANRSYPQQIGSLTDWKSVSCGQAHTIAVKTNGTLWSWGLATGGALGNGTLTSLSSPVQIGSLTTWASGSAGSQYFSIFLTS